MRSKRPMTVGNFWLWELMLNVARRYCAVVMCLLYAVCFTSDVSAVPVQPSSPTYSWLFDDGTGTTAIARTGGQGGTLTNGPTWTGDTPFSYAGDNSISFSIADPTQHVKADSIIPHDDSAWADFSVSAWFKPDDTGTHRGIVTDFTPGGGSAGIRGNFLIRMRPIGTVDAAVWDVGGGTLAPHYLESSGTANTDVWNHVAVVSTGNGSTITIYLNGVATAGSARVGFGASSTIQNFLIGSITSSFAQFSGAIDEVAIWNSALSADNVEWLGTNSISQIPLPPPNVPGDFDSDGDVDGADFVAWQTHFPTVSGATLATGDADGDGDVDGADFVVWQTHFPTTAGSGAAAVPEPSGMLFVISGWTVVVAVRHNRRHFAQCETTLISRRLRRLANVFPSFARRW